MLKQKERIERLHLLIKRQATGNPKDCSRKLEISERQLYNILELMKELGAPILYDNHTPSYYYTHEVELFFGFTKKSY